MSIKRWTEKQTVAYPYKWVLLCAKKNKVLIPAKCWNLKIIKLFGERGGKKKKKREKHFLNSIYIKFWKMKFIMKDHYDQWSWEWGIREGETVKREWGNFGVMDIYNIMAIVMVSWVYIYNKTYFIFYLCRVYWTSITSQYSFLKNGSTEKPGDLMDFYCLDRNYPHIPGGAALLQWKETSKQ